MPEQHNFTRRSAIGIIGVTSAFSAIGLPAANAGEEVCTSHTAEAREPLSRMITAYRAGLEEFNRTCPDDGSNEVWNDLAHSTWVPFFDALANWDRPATTLEGAVAALRCAYIEERDCGGSDITVPLMAAAMGYFDNHTQT